MCAALFAVNTMVLADSPSPITITASSCFSGMAPRGVYPVSVEITNAGPPVQGAIRVKEESYEQSGHVYNYPIDLPTGTTKRVIAYPSLNQFGSSIDVDLVGAGHFPGATVPIQAEGDYGNQQSTVQVGLIGDDDGGMVAIRTVAGQAGQAQPASHPATSYQDCYCKPEDAPDRGVGYSGLSALLIGAGAERLSSDQWDAIRQYALGGGNVVLLGGAGSLAYLNTPGALRLSPLSSFQQTQTPALTVSGNSYGPAVLIVGPLEPGATIYQSQGSLPLISEMNSGAGIVSLVAFDPLEQNLRQSPTARKLFTSVIPTSDPAAPSTMQAWAVQRLQAMREQDMSQKPLGSKGGDVNPFRITLPPLGTVAAIFLVYFITVVPVTYFVLKKIGKLEWAWVTSPLISIAFAFVFYVFTMSLYQAGLS